MLKLRELEADGDEILAVGEELLAIEKAARDALGAEIEPGASPAEVMDVVKDDHAATFAESLGEYRATMDASRRFVVEHGIATLPDEDHLNVIETPAFIRHLVPFAAYYDPAKFDPVPVGTYIVTPPSSPEMMREHNRSADQQHLGARGVPRAPPPARGRHHQPEPRPALLRGPRVHRGLGLLLRADDEGGRLRRHAEGVVRRPHRCHLARDPDHPRRPAPSRRHRLRRCGRSARRRDRVRAAGRAGGGEAIHLDADVSALLSLRPPHDREAEGRCRGATRAPTSACQRFHDTLIYGGTMPVSYARRLFELNGR